MKIFSSSSSQYWYKQTEEIIQGQWKELTCIMNYISFQLLLYPILTFPLLHTSRSKDPGFEYTHHRMYNCHIPGQASETPNKKKQRNYPKRRDFKSEIMENEFGTYL